MDTVEIKTILPQEFKLTPEATILMDTLSQWPTTNGIPLACSSYLLTSSEPTQSRKLFYLYVILTNNIRNKLSLHNEASTLLHNMKKKPNIVVT
jgi:hypothetical protein